MSNENNRRGDGEFDLEERTALFGEDAIEFLKKVPVNDITSPLIRRLAQSSTNIGASYRRASESETNKHFRGLIYSCKNDSWESKHWLRMIAAAAMNLKKEARALWKEADELNRIFAAIHRNSNDDKDS
jgi:four helix bundle protein